MTGDRQRASARWSFRTRLAVLIAGVFIVGGAVLLGVQYLLLQQLVSTTMGSVTVCGVDAAGTIVQGNGQDTPTVPPGCDAAASGPGAVQVVVTQTGELFERVLSGLALWSAVILVVFAGLAVLTARWLSGRSLGRIAQITRLTQDFTTDGSRRRLGLAGPDDEIKQLGDTIDGMLERVDEAYERQERFIAGASHELRTPLTTARTLLEIPLEQGRVPAELESAVRGSIAAGERAEAIIAALLALARSGSRRAGTPAELDVVALLHELVRKQSPRAEAYEVVVTLVDDGTRPTIHADPSLVRIALGNVLDNAIHHNRVGGAVRIAFEQDARSLGIVVVNDGADLTGTDVDALLEPFHRGEESRLSGGGLGLGLPLAQSILSSQGATLTLHARDAGGLRVAAEFPV